MSFAHIKQNLPLKNKVIPVDSDTTFLAHYDISKNDVLRGVKPIGYSNAISLGTGSCYISIPNPLANASTFTISFWMKHNSPGPWTDILTFDTGADGTACRIEKDNTTTSYRWYIDGGFPGGTLLFDHDGLQWDYITLVNDGTTVRSYKNGAQVYSVTRNAALLPNCSFINVGRRLTSQYWNGFLMGLAMWNIARSPQQIATDMVQEPKGNEPGLVGYWRLDEGDGNIANDSSTKGNSGVITNPIWGAGNQISTLTPEGYYGGGIRVEAGTTNTWTGDYVVYNNYGVPATIVNTGRTFRGMPVWRIGMTVDDAHAANLGHFQSELSSHGVYGGSQTWEENVPYVSSIYWRPVNKWDMVFGGVASNTAGWASGGNEDVGEGWKRFHRYRTGVGVATKTDSVHHSFYCPSLQLNETIYFDFCGAQTERSKRYPTSYIPSGTTRNNGFFCYPSTIFDYTKGTFSCWAKTDTSSSQRNLFFQWDTTGGTISHFGLRMNETGTITFAYGAVNATSPTSYNDGQYHFYAVTWDDSQSQTRLYIDGVLVATGANTVPVGQIGGRHMNRIPIGHQGWTHLNNWWNGTIDEIRIDKVARTSDEILAWYYSNSPFWPKGIYKVSY